MDPNPQVNGDEEKPEIDETDTGNVEEAPTTETPAEEAIENQSDK